jgi:hypothetical protein
VGRQEVTIGRWKPVYLAAGETVGGDDEIWGFDATVDRKLENHPRMRRILLRGMPHWPLNRYLLHWSDGTDLEALDKRVTAGSASEEDFAGAVLGDLSPFLHRDCGTTLRTVKLDTTFPLFPDDRTRAQAHRYQAECPACGGELRGGILEFIDE